MPTLLNTRTTAEHDMAAMRHAIRRLTTSDSSRLILLLDGADAADAVRIPATAILPFVQILEMLARGQAPAVLALDHELTTQEAADLLNVSRPTLVKLLEDGKIPFHRFGSHRRLKLADVLSYRELRSKVRSAALEQLMEEEQALGLPD